MKRILSCPGSLTLDVPKRAGSSYAAEGTEAHDHAADLLRERLTGSRKLPACSDEMYSACKVFADFVMSLNPAEASGYAIETTIESKAIPGFGGTPDYWQCSRNGVVDIVDFKYGAGVPVVAEQNEQLLSYAVLLAECLIVENPQTFRLTIVQPRTAGDAVETWETDRATVDIFANRIRAIRNHAHFCAGDHCRWCPALATCDHLHAKTVELAQLEFSEIDGNAERWLEILRLAPAVKKLIESIPGRMLDAMQKGAEFPGWKAVKALGNRSWKFDDAATLKALAKLKIGKKLATKSVLLSPTQLEKAGHEGFEDLVTRPERGLALVPVTDKRPAMVFQSAAETFDDLSFLD